MKRNLYTSLDNEYEAIEINNQFLQKVKTDNID